MPAMKSIWRIDCSLCSAFKVLVIVIGVSVYYEFAVVLELALFSGFIGPCVLRCSAIMLDSDLH